MKFQCNVYIDLIAHQHFKIKHQTGFTSKFWERVLCLEGNKYTTQFFFFILFFYEK